MVVSKYWSASSNAHRSSTDTARLLFSTTVTLRGFDGLKPLFFCKLSNSAILAAIMQVITAVIEQSAKAVAPRVVLS
jgi:hypothetical protein